MVQIILIGLLYWNAMLLDMCSDIGLSQIVLILCLLFIDCPTINRIALCNETGWPNELSIQTHFGGSRDSNPQVQTLVESNHQLKN